MGLDFNATHISLQDELLRMSIDQRLKVYLHINVFLDIHVENI